MKPNFDVLRKHHPGLDVGPDEVYAAIGLPAEMAQDPTWSNTCAIRMSVALTATGMRIRPASLIIKAGPFKGQMVQASQRRLSEFLAKALGAPEKYGSGQEAQRAIGSRRGIVSFFRFAGRNQGHIDLVSVRDWPQIHCSVHCYWYAEEVWFWPL